MSYLPGPSYLGSVSGAQNNQRGYGAAGTRNTAAPNIYQSQQIRGGDENQQQQYSQSAYGWSGHTSNASTTATHNGYATDSWRDRSTSGNPYDYRRDTYQPTAQVGADSQAYQSRDPYGNQDTQGLNNLAYASGLDTTVPSTQAARASPYQQAEICSSSTAGSNTQTRTSLPENSNRRYIETNISQPPSSGQYSVLPDNLPSTGYSQGLSSSTHSSHTRLGRNNSSQPSPQPHSSNIARATNSPSMRNVQSAQNVSQKTVPNHSIVPGPASHNRKTSAQTRPSSSMNSSKIQSTTPGAQKKASPVQRRATPKQQQQQQSQADSGSRQPPKQTSATQQPATNNPQSIANLVSNNQEPDPPVYESVENQESMPNYIDPTQVFNPYHREHERKRREMAEQEARKAAEQKRLAEAGRVNAERSRNVTDASTTANSKSNTTDKGRIGNSAANSKAISHSSADTASTAPENDDMATELQKMMLKMKEYRKTNPALFQKLWNDMRGGGSAAAPTAPPPPPPTQSPSPQVTQASLPKELTKSIPQAKPRSKKSEFDSPYPGVPSNGYRVVVENNPQGLPDLGRFPAERRIRTSYNKNKTDTSSHQTQQGQDMSNALGTTPQQSGQPQVATAQPLPMRTTPAAQPRAAEPGLAWPEPRRRAVAIAAVHLLKSNPENAAVTISAQEICSILERNSSYLDLCTALESHGLKFQRTVFARELLRSVPELQTPVTKVPASTAEAMATVSSAAQVPLPLPATPVTDENSQHSINPYAQAQFERNTADPNMMRQDPNFLKSEYKSVHKHVNKASKARTSSSNRPEPPPGSKAAAARKSDFAELIDLTELDGDDNYVMPEKRPRMESPPMSHIQQLENSMRTGFSANPTQPLRFDPQPVSQTRSTMPIAQSAYFQNPLVQQPRFDVYQQPAPQDGGKSRMILARKIDKAEAMLKSYYDPKTVARDVLIASGRHSSERPLNVHLAGLLGKYSDLDSDIGTFDWDAVDPGGPPPPKVEHVDISAGPPRFKLVGRLRKRMKLMDQTLRTPDDKAEVETASTRPTSVMRDHPRTQEPSPSPSLINATQDSSRDSDKGFLRNHNIKNRESKFPAINNLAQPSRKISIDLPPAPTIPNPQQTSKSKPNMDTTIKRRGRPPGSKNKYPSVAALKQQAKATVTETAVEVAPEPVLHTYKCKWVKCHAELHNLDTLKRHVLKNHTPAQSQVQTEDFVCWWKRCRFLEPDGNGNMAPTRVFKDKEEWLQHVDKDHLQPIAQKYGDGPKSTNTGKHKLEGFDLSNFRYKSPVSPDARTRSHIDPHSLEIGHQRYLTDRNGRATTPLVSSDGNSDHPPDAMVLTRAYSHVTKNEKEKEKEKVDISSQNAYLKAHGNKTKDPRRIAEEVVRAHEVRKQAIGPSIDRGGCTLINEARRSTFVQAPGISRIVDADY